MCLYTMITKQLTNPGMILQVGTNKTVHVSYWIWNPLKISHWLSVGDISFPFLRPAKLMFGSLGLLGSFSRQARPSPVRTVSFRGAAVSSLLPIRKLLDSLPECNRTLILEKFHCFSMLSEILLDNKKLEQLRNTILYRKTYPPKRSIENSAKI